MASSDARSLDAAFDAFLDRAVHANHVTEARRDEITDSVACEVDKALAMLSELSLLPQLAVGASIKVIGLVSRPHLNERHGVVVGTLQKDRQPPRWPVRVGGEDMLLRTENLEPGTDESTRRQERQSHSKTARRSAEAELAAVQAAERARDATPVDAETEAVLALEDEKRFRVSIAALNANPDSFFETLLRQREMGLATAGASGDGALTVKRPSAHFVHIRRFLETFERDFPNVVVDPALDEAALAALEVEADFYLLPALMRLLEARRATGPRGFAPLAPDDLMHREREDLLRYYFAHERDSPLVAPLHIGLTRVFSGPGGAAAPPLPIVRLQRDSPYHVTLDLFSQRYGDRMQAGASAIVPDLTAFLARFDRAFPELREKLGGVPVSETCGWFIAGGAVLRCLLHDTGGLFAGNDVDIFVYARGESAQVDATELARQICALLNPAASEPAPSTEPRRPRSYPLPRSYYNYRGSDKVLTRTLFTLDLEMQSSDSRGYSACSTPIQIVLRTYHSPSEVLCGFDIDCCCVGFDGANVWALPRALTALSRSLIVLNPLHAWPRQPSCEMRRPGPATPPPPPRSPPCAPLISFLALCLSLVSGPRAPPLFLAALCLPRSLFAAIVRPPPRGSCVRRRAPSRQVRGARFPRGCAFYPRSRPRSPWMASDHVVQAGGAARGGAAAAH